MSHSPEIAEWIDIKDAGKRLGRGWGRNTIKRRIDKSQLIEGIHYRDDRLPDALYGTYKINITAIVQDFCIPIIQRSA
jgi:hypothetical protein